MVIWHRVIKHIICYTFVFLLQFYFMLWFLPCCCLRRRRWFLASSVFVFIFFHLLWQLNCVSVCLNPIAPTKYNVCVVRWLCHLKNKPSFLLHHTFLNRQISYFAVCVSGFWFDDWMDFTIRLLMECFFPPHTNHNDYRNWEKYKKIK